MSEENESSSSSSWLPKLTLEPVIFFFMFFGMVMNGAQQMTNLKHDTICAVTLNRSAEDCANRGFDQELQIEVQRIGNKYQFLKNGSGFSHSTLSWF